VERLLGYVLAAVVVELPVRLAVEAPSLEEVLGAEVYPPLVEVVGAEAVVHVAVVLLANNRYRSQGHGYRRCYRCRDRGRYHHPARRHRYRGASPSRPSHLHSGHGRCRLAVFGNNASRLFFLSNLFLPLGKMDLASQFVDPMATPQARIFHYNRGGIEISFGQAFGR
jgi:hypothetical protein